MKQYTMDFGNGVLSGPDSHEDDMFSPDTIPRMSNANENPQQPVDHPLQPWRIVGPTQQQWIDVKDIFTQLYIGENRKLREVREILSKKHGFNASEKMFKRRIADWKIHKNYKAKDKENLARRVKAYVDAGHDIQSISFHGRPVKLDRVKRHCRTDKRFAQLWEHLSQSPEAISIDEVPIKEDSPSTAITRSTPSNASSTSPDFPDSHMKDSIEQGLGPLTVAINPPIELYNMQSTLFHTREAVRWQFTAFTPLSLTELQLLFPDSVPKEVRAGQIDQASAFWLGLYHGFDHIQTGRLEDGWRTFDDCCQMVEPLIRSTPLQLLSCLIVHFATAWQGMAVLEHHLLGFVSSMASKVLGKGHPLAKALDLITTATLRDQALESMMDLVIEGYKARRKAGNSSLFALRVDQIDMLRKRKKFEQGHSMCQQLIKDSQSMARKRYRTALAALGRLYADQNQEFAVEGVAHRILEHEASDTGFTNSGTAAWACDQLATLCMNRGDYGLAEQYLRRAASMSSTQLPHRGPSTTTFVKRLDSCMRQQGRTFDVDKVCADLGIDTKFGNA